MTHYQRGVYLERLARDLLHEQGYAVLRAADSKGAVDLAAFNAREVQTLIQVKRPGALRPAEQQALSALPVPRQTRVEIWE